MAARHRRGGARDHHRPVTGESPPGRYLVAPVTAWLHGRGATRNVGVGLLLRPGQGRRPCLGVRLLRGGSGLQQDAGAFDIAVQDRQMQCRSLVVVGALHRGQVGTTPDHNCDSGDIALFGGGEEPRCLG